MEMTEKALPVAENEFIPFWNSTPSPPKRMRSSLMRLWLPKSDWYRTAEEAEENHRRMPI